MAEVPYRNILQRVASAERAVARVRKIERRMKSPPLSMILTAARLAGENDDRRRTVLKRFLQRVLDARHPHRWLPELVLPYEVREIRSAMDEDHQLTADYDLTRWGNGSRIQ